MNEYLFLYFLGFVAVLFAAIQDIRTREIANWLTFSLIAFVIAYRAFYSIYSENFMFFIYGLGGVFLFIGLGYLFYYSKIFAGGDAKLLFGLGGIFPYTSFFDYIYYGLGFVLVLFSAGVFYTLIYSSFLVSKNYPSFRKSLKRQIYEKRYFFVFSLILSILILSNKYFYGEFFALLFFSFFILFSPLLFAYVRAVESSCMIQLVSPNLLTEGDWLEKDIKARGKLIKKNFAGLSLEEILLLRKVGKKVWIKTGVPFAPAFLIAFVIFILMLRYSFF